ncbi:ubiquitin-like protein 7 [Bombus vancouverensis nearcticus]|uniref:Ubiquitin-like protein 7 n=1 Tax=Bombus bifarius TaxID=103933 RepID=A0A6P8MS49_9HYME|nr:ubiquitin-like protein 7 [Bombus vancouverensis nearcticus]XP_033305195.1 ubiquitin-like protein 7 [Bombus bifarius]
MSSELILGVRLDPQTLTTIKLNDINFKTKVEKLKYETAGRVNLSKDLFELIYCGCVLEDDMTLESYGLKNGSMVHVLRRREPELPSFPKCISEDGILQLVSAFKSFKENPGLRSALNRIGKKPEVMDNIISSSPGLHEDTVAIAILQDPDLMSYFTDVDTVRRFAEAHPVLVEAAQNIAAAVHAEAHNNVTVGSNSSLSNSQPAAYSYSLDNLSGDEEMAGDSSQSSDSTQTPNLSSNPANSTVTVAQLAAAVSRARAGSFPLSNPASSTSAGSTNSGIITTEMFTQAMQQVHSPSVLPRSSDLRRMLAQMHELGLQNDTLNLRALHLTNHDVIAAIELVFSGFSNN